MNIHDQILADKIRVVLARRDSPATAMITSPRITTLPVPERKAGILAIGMPWEFVYPPFRSGRQFERQSGRPVAIPMIAEGADSKREATAKCDSTREAPRPLPWFRT